MKKLCLLFTALTLFIFLSCEIGLGASVDTEAPSLEITMPPADAVIRQSFNVSGTWKDDGSISSVNIKMVRLDNDNGNEKTFSGTVNTTDGGKGTWNIVVNPVESGLTDGTYEALVSINDNGGHTTSMARTFTIDNTPPVLILTKPNSTLSADGEEETTLSVYGKTLFLEGSIADSTKETWIEMKFYSDPSCAEEYYLDTIETDSIAPTNVNQNNTRFAEYDSEITDDTEVLKDNTYSNIYIRSDNIEKIKKGAVPVYATLTVYDTAETYSLSHSNDKNEVIKTEKSKLKNHVKGNSTETFYISADLAKDITKSKSTGGKGLAPIDIYNILNGSQAVKDKARSVENDDTLTKEALENALKSKGKTKSVFSVNPDNNPYFTVSGLKTLTGSGQDFASADNGYYIKNGALTLEISVFMGSDSFELEANDPDFYAYLLECDSYGNPLKEDIEANRLKLYSKYKETGTGKDKKMLYKIGGKEGHKTTNGAYVFSVPMNKTINTNTDSGIIEYDKLDGSKLTYGHNYLIRVNGKDVEGNKIDNESNKYGFRFTSSGAAPEITITKPNKSYVNLKKGDDLRIEGTVKTEEPDVILSISMGSDSEPISNVELEPTENPSVYNFAYTLKHTDGGKIYFSQDESKEYSVLVTATGEAKAFSNIFVSYDVDPPVITKNSEQPLVQLTKPDGSVLNCINGIFTLSGIITDNDIFDSATYKVSQNNICKISDTYIPGKFIIPINTRNLEDETPVTIEINAKDRSGNPAKEVYEYFVSQKTDKPDISNGADNVNLDADYATIAVPYNETTKDFYNMFQRKTNLYLNIQDDDGLVKKVTVDLQKFKSNGNSIEPDKDENGNDIKVETAVYESRDVIQYPLPDEEGIYFAVVKAYDINYDFTHPAENDANYNFSKKSFFLKVTGNGPDVTLKPDRDFISTANENGADLNIEFTVADVGNGPYTVYMNDGSGNKPLFDGTAKTSPFDVSLHFNKDVTSCADIKFTVKDKNNVGTEKKFSPKFDNEKPNIDFSNSGWPVKPERTEDETFFFKGVIDDNEAAGKEVAGVDKVQIRYVTGDFNSAVDAIAAAEAETSPAVSTNWIDATVAGKAWNYEAIWQSDELKNVFATENTKTVIVNAIDGAGNSKMASRKFIFDKMIPEVFEVTGADYKNGNSVELTIKYRDTNPDGASLKILDISGHVPASDAYAEGTNPITIEELSSVEDSETGKTIKTIKATVVFPKTKRTGENGAEISYLLEDGTYEIQITAKDLNNRESKTYKYQVTRDTKNPELDNITMSTNSTVNKVHNPEKGKYFVNNKNQTFTISGLAKDNIGVENIKLEIFRITKSKTDATATPVVDSTALITKTANAQIWSFNNIEFSDSAWIQETDAYKTIGAKATITVTDKAGNSNQEDLTITFDTTPPVSIHEMDDKFKDLYFRIGNANNDDITKTNAGKYGLTWSKEKDEGIGNKYSNGAYGNDLTIQIRGNFDDGENGSGVKKIYYQVKDSDTLISDLLLKDEYTGKTETEVLALFAKEIAENTSDTKSFSPLESPETKRVFYNSTVTTDQTSDETSYDGSVGGRITGSVNQLTQQANAETGTPAKPTAKFYKDVVTTYKNSITGFKEGSNYVILVVEDNVGNLSLDVARNIPYKDENGNAATGTFINYSLNVDTVVPVITSNNTDTLYTNQSGYVELSGTVNDDGAGLGSLKFNLNNTELEVYNEEEGDVIPDDLTQITKCLVTITTTELGPNEEKRKNTWNIKIPSSKFDDSETTYTVYAIAKDNAGTGNDTKESVGTIKVDTTAPVITIASPKANTLVNKEIIFSGSISDGTNSAGIDTSAEKAPKLYWTTNTDAKDSNLDPKALAANAAAGWVELALSTAEAPSALTAKNWNTTSHEWTFTVDTEKLKADGSKVVTNGTAAYFTISASDKSGSGNTGYAPVHALIIDQNSDRPVIKFSNLDISSMTNNSRVWITKEELYASVTDDDGEVEAVEISFDGTNESSWSDQDAQGNKYYTKENGLSITLPSDKDGEQQIWFKVKDAKGTIFTSSATTDAAVTTAPKLAYKNVEFGASPATDTTPARYYSMLYAKIDLGDPKIPLAYYMIAETEDSPVQDADALLTLIKKDENGKLTDDLTDAAKQSWQDLSGVKTAIGGSTKYIYIFTKATDENGIKSIAPKFGETQLQEFLAKDIDNGKLALYKIDISSMTGTADYKLELKTTDNATRVITRSFDMSIDKEAPVVYIDSPASAAALYGTAGVVDSNVTIRGRSDSDAVHIYMAVTESEDIAPNPNNDYRKYNEITKNSALTWNVIFNGKKGQNSQTDYYEDRFNTWVDYLYGEGTSENNSVKQKNVCLYFYAEDGLGNSGINNPKKLPLTIYTQGDRPTIEISNPEKPKNNVLSTVGGIITVTGSTSIAINTVENIWLQIDPDYDAETGFASNWESKLNALFTEKFGSEKTEAELFALLGYKIEASGNQIIGNGIKAGGSKASWNLAINKASEFNKFKNDGTPENRTIAIRAYAVGASERKRESDPDLVVFTLDPNAPVFGQVEGYPLSLVQWSNNEVGTGTIVTSRLYEPNLYLKGKWWLRGSVSDDSGIASIEKDSTEIRQTYCSEITGTGNYILNIPLSGEGELKSKIIAKENASTNKSSELPIELNFDNSAPDFECTSLNKPSNQITQNNGVYELTGTFNDNNGSGFERIAFYVTRNNNNYLTDIMLKQIEGIADDYNSYNPANLIHNNNSETDLFWKQLSNCKIMNSNEVFIPTYTTQTLPTYVRRGAICRINNIIYRIKNLEANTEASTKDYYPVKMYLDSKLNDENNINVDIALAQIIDHKGSEQGLTEFYDKAYDFGDKNTSERFTNDDNDQMVETFRETSGEWTVSINSQNIRDGSVTIHFVAFDKAGNATYKSYTGVVANNAPRFAGVKFGTDVNGDGTVDTSENSTELKTAYTGWYNASSDFKQEGVKENGKASNGNKITNWALPNNDRDITAIDENAAPVMTVKGKIRIIPEIVGGNGGLGWKYRVGSGSDSAYTPLTDEESLTDDIRDTITTAFEIDTLELLGASSTDGEKVFTFTISDKTGGELGNQDNSTAELKLKFYVALRDEEKPVAGIKPFYWDKAGENNNSLYYKEVNNKKEAAGHIELPQDLPNTFTYKTGGELTTGINDIDPKVSGIVYLEGFAKDNVVVEKLLLRAYKAGATPGSFVEIAERDRSVDGSGNPSSDYGKFIAKTSLESEGIFFTSFKEKTLTEAIPGTTIKTDYNIINWKVAIDTAKIAASVTGGQVAGSDIIIEVQAKDRGKAYEDENTGKLAYENPQSSGTSSLQTGLKQNAEGTDIALTADTPTFDDSVQTPYYRVDVVPYVTAITTNLSSLKKKNPSVYARTALGHYPVASTENPVILGYNLEGGVVNFVSSNENAVTTSYTSDAWGIQIPSNAKSGKISVTVNSVTSLNNVNNDEAKGSYTGSVDLSETPTGNKTIYENYYNRQPNGDNNNLLTDDVEFDIWEFNNEAVVPISGNIEQPQMKINPVTGQLGFAFVNGPLYFSMPGKVGEINYSYQYWCNTLDFFTSVGLAYDKLGYSYAVAAGGDINTNTADKYVFLSDRIGKAVIATGGDAGYSTKKSANAIRIESVGMIGTKTDSTDETRYFEKQRAKSSSLATAVHGNEVNVYLAYYDAMTNEIRFKTGTTCYPNKKVTGYTTESKANQTINASEYMKWYYHAIYKQEEGLSQNRKFIGKGNAINPPDEVTNIKFTAAGSDYKNKTYEAVSFLKGTTGVSDAGTADNICFLTLKDYSESDMNDFVAGLINNTLLANNKGMESEAYASIMEKADAAYDGGYSEEFWGIQENNWGKQGRGWAVRHNIKDLLEGIKFTINYQKAVTENTTKVFDNFQNTEVPSGSTYPPRQYNLDNVSLIAGEGTGRDAGEYVSIDVVPKKGDADKDVVVVVWYDQNSRSLRYAYNDNPTPELAGAEHQSEWAAAWKGVNEIFGDMDDYENAGEYCQLAVDAKGGIHIAAYDGSTTDIVYAYLESYDDNEPQVCVVDSAGVVGSNLTIDVALDSEDGPAIPRIGYYSNSCVRPKLAYLVDTTTSNPEGAVEEEFTGKWEVSVVPIEEGRTLNMQSAQYNKINVALWKTRGGVLTNSNDTNTFSPGTQTAADNVNTLNSFDSTSYGFVYGNGTSNAVLGYAVKEGAGSTIETAQMK